MAALDIWTPPTDPKVLDLTADAYLNPEVRDNINVAEKVIVADDSSQFLHLHLAGTLAQRPPAGNVGREYYVTDLGACFFDNGKDWRYLWHNPKLCDRYYYEFELDRRGELIDPADNQTLPVSHGWQAEVSKKSGTDSRIRTDSREGINLRTANKKGATVKLSPVGESLTTFEHGSDNPTGPTPMIWETRVKGHDNADADIHFGIMDLQNESRPPAPPWAMIWRVQDGGLYSCYSSDGSDSGPSQETETDVSAEGVAGGGIDTPFKTFRIDWLTAPSGTNGDGLVKFYADGVLKATHVRVPTLNDLMMAFLIRTNANANKDMTVMYVHSLQRRTTF